MIIRNYKYTPEDVDCRYCTEFIHNRCRATKYPWLNERIEAGVRFEIDKSRISIRLTAPYSEERRKQYHDQATRNSFFKDNIKIRLLFSMRT